MDRRYILKYKKLLFLILFSVFFTSVLAADCCLNPYNLAGYFCTENVGVESFCCQDPAGGFTDSNYIPGEEGFFTKSEAEGYCEANWLDSNGCTGLTECETGCCIGDTKTCQEIKQGECALDPTADFYPGQACSDISECTIGCCCDGEIKQRKFCDTSTFLFYENLEDIEKCIENCDAQADSCTAQSCEYSDPNCVCGGALTNNQNPFCCGADSNVYPNRESCEANSKCAPIGEYSISGIVEDQNGNNILDAIVRIGTRSVLNSFSGYIFENVPGGTYTITAEKAGYVTGSKQIQIINEDLTGVNFVLATTGECGNGNPEEGEECDKGDRNGVPGSGCTIFCTFENQCGNNVVEYPEQCDDGNTRSGDGCSYECLIESICGNAETGSPQYISSTNNPWIEGSEECDDGNNAEGDGCSPLCMFEVECEIGSTRTKSCVSQYVEETVKGADDSDYTFKCPTQESCVDKDGDGIGEWNSICDKIDPDCPTFCTGTGFTNIGDKFCPSSAPICIGDIKSPDIVEGNNLGLVCCRAKTGQDAADICIPEEQINECSYKSCENSNSDPSSSSSVPCTCGSIQATASKAYCCADDNMVFLSNTGSSGCYKLSNNCKPNCIPLDGLSEGKKYVDIESEYPDSGCLCSGATRQAGYCCEDGSFIQTNPEDCEFTKNFAVVEGYITHQALYPGGTGIDSAEVIITGVAQTSAGDQDFTLRTITDPDGKYLFNSVPLSLEGQSHTITAGKRRVYNQNSKQEQITINRLTESGNAVNIALTPLPRYRVDGTVYKEADSSAIEGAIVSIEDVQKSADTGSSGYYVFDPSIENKGVTEGTYMFMAGLTGSGLVSEKKRVDVFRSGDPKYITGIDFYLKDGNCYLGKYKADPDILAKNYKVFEGWDLFDPISVKEINPVKGKIIAEINWENACPAKEFNIYRCEGTYEECGGGDSRNEQSILPPVWKYVATEGESKRAYVDKNLKPNTNYCYRLGVEYEYPFIAEVLSVLDDPLQCFETGDMECIAKKGLDTFCGEDGNVYGCDDNNRLVQTADGDCSGKRCSQTTSKTSICINDADCSECNKPLGLFGKITTLIFRGSNKRCEDIPFCYEDYTETTIDQYFDCSQVTSCYDYKSKDACEGDPNINRDGNVFGTYNNRCLTRDCIWESDPEYANLGFGTCREPLLSELCPEDSDCDGLLDSQDEDDDNDYSPDRLDYDDMTVDSILQDCSRCNTDEERNPVFMKCDPDRCSLYGDCYYTGALCVPKHESDCSTYQTQTDCENDANIFGFGSCFWDTTDEICIKDISPLDGVWDCVGSDCLRDFNPPLTKIPYLPKYKKENLNFRVSVFDDFTDSYVGGDSNTYYAYHQLGKATLAEYDSTETAKTISLKDEEDISDGDFSLSYYSINEQEEMEFNSEVEGGGIPSQFSFEVDDTSPEYVVEEYTNADKKHDKMYYRCNPEKCPEDDGYSEGPPATFSYLVDAYLAQEDPDVYLSDLTVNFTLSEPAVCAIFFKDINGVMDAEPEKVTLNDMSWMQQDYGDDFTLFWPDLKDGLYKLNYLCYDDVLNELPKGGDFEEEIIVIDSDPSIQVVQPNIANNNHKFSTNIINVEIRTKNPFECRLMDMEESFVEGSKLVLEQISPTEYKHTLNLAVPFPQDSKQDYHMKVGCMTSFGESTKFIHFFIDGLPPQTKFEKEFSPAYDPNTWYSLIAGLNIKCEDPIIRSPEGLVGEFGCDSLRWCTGPDCEFDGSRIVEQDPIQDVMPEAVTSKRSLDVCYQSKDKGGNEEQRACSIIKIDAISPIIDDVTFDPKETLYDTTSLTAYIGDYLTENIDFYRTNPLGNVDSYESDFELDEFKMKFTLALGEVAVGGVNEFELVRLRESDKGYYSLDINAIYDTITVNKIDSQGNKLHIHSMNYINKGKGFVPGEEYEFLIVADRSNLFKLEIKETNGNTNGKEQATFTDNHPYNINKGIFKIPAVQADITRTIDKIRIAGDSGRTSPISKTTITVNEGTLFQETYEIANSPKAIEDLRINILKEGNNSVKICSTDSATPFPNTGCETFYAYQDHVGPVIEAYVMNHLDFQDVPVESSTQDTDDLFVQYGHPFNISIYAEDEEWTNEVRFLGINILKDGSVIYSNGINNPDENTEIEYPIDPSCIIRMDCQLREGMYELTAAANDKLGNPASETYYFEVRDTIAPNFTITMSNPDGFENYTLRGYTYEVNITGSEPLSSATIPRLWFNVNSHDIDVTSMQQLDNFTYTGILDFTRVIGALKNLDDVLINFQIEAYDNQETLGTEIVSGRSFRIDTKGYTAPTVYYPDDYTLNTVYEGIQSGGKTLITGIEGDGESGRTIKAKTTFIHPDEKTYLEITGSEWVKEASTVSADEPQKYGIAGTIIETAPEGQNWIKIQRDDSFEDNDKRFIDFATHNRETMEFYEADNYIVITDDVATITLKQPLEQDVDGIFHAYSAKNLQGMFSVDASLGIGENYIYTFSYDEREVRSDAAEEIIRAVYDPYYPEITPVSPWAPASDLLSDHFMTPKGDMEISAIIEDNITNLLIDSIQMVLDYRLRGSSSTNTMICNCTSCTGEIEGIFTCDVQSDQNVTVEFDPSGSFEDAIYEVMISARDYSNNLGTNRWRFEVDKNIPHKPYATSPDGATFLDVLYTDEQQPELYVDFRGDEGKFVNVSRVDLAKGTIQNIVQNNLSFTWINNAGVSLADINENYTTNYSITLNQPLEGNDEIYYIILESSKLYAVDDSVAPQQLNFSDKALLDAEFKLDSTAPAITVDMETPTMIKTPYFRILTDDPSNCSYSTDKPTALKYPWDIGFEFEDILEEHEIEMKQLAGSKYLETQHKDLLEKGNYEMDITCTNILGLSNTVSYPFNIVFPKVNKVYYKPGEAFEIILRLDQANLLIVPDFSEIGIDIPYIISSQGTNYTIKSNIPYGISDSQYKVPIDIRNQDLDLIDTTEVLLYTHGGSWVEDDFSLAYSCYVGSAGQYFGEWNCEWTADVLYVLDRIGLVTEESDCFNDADNDGDGIDDISDPDCSVYYSIRNQKGYSSAVSYNDPVTSGVGRLCLGAESNGYCSNANDVQVYYTESNRQGDDIKILFARNAALSDQRVQIGIIDPPFTQQFSNQQLTPAFVNDEGNIEINSPSQTLDDLYEYILINVPSDAQDAGYATTIASYNIEGAGQSPGVALEHLVVSGTYSSAIESGYTENGLSVRCTDGIDNDLDSGSFTPMGGGNPAGFDCRDTDCHGKDVLEVFGQTVQCQDVETTCYDRFDNDYDADYDDNDYDFSAASGVDCRDEGCDNLLGALSGQDGCLFNDGCYCQLLEEENCQDGFNNDFLNKKDCEMDATDKNPTADSAEYDCAVSCRHQNEITENDETGNLCGDGLDNDWDAITVNGLNSHSQNNAGGVDCRYNHDGNHRADPDCGGTTVTISTATPGRTGSPGTGTCQLNTETSCSDNFDNDQDGLSQNAGWTLEAYDHFTQFGMIYSKGADCDDYDCLGKGSCPTDESSNPAWCFDGIDNDLDDPKESNSMNARDCADIDCDGVVNPDDADQVCEYGEEVSCTDGFDNDGDGLTDEDDDDCTTAVCYPRPESENITYDSCSDGFDNDNDEVRNEAGSGTDCTDSDCDGMPCGPNKICEGGNCISKVEEVCDDAIDNDDDEKYDCEDSKCFGDPYCTGRVATNPSTIYQPNAPVTTGLTIGGDIAVKYTSYVRQGEKLKVNFKRTNTGPTTATMYIGYGSRNLGGIAGVSSGIISDTSFDIFNDVIGGLLRANKEGAGAFDITIEVPVLANPSATPKQIDINTNTIANPNNLGTISIMVLENIKPSINGVEVRTRDDTAVIFVKATDDSGIAKCRFKAGNRAWADQKDCIYRAAGLGSSETIQIEVYDGAGNIETTQQIVQTFDNRVVSFDLDTTYITPENDIWFDVEYEGSDILTGAPCTAVIYRVEEGLLEEVKTEQYAINNNKCSGTIDLSELDNGSYSIDVRTAAGGQVLVTGYMQFFKCRNIQFPTGASFAGFHCMDECQISKPLPNIEIEHPSDGQTLIYPLIKVNGTIEPNVLLEIFVNSFDESQYQANIENAQEFDAKAMVISKGENTIIARVTDRDNLLNSDEVTVSFDGARVITDVAVNGLPENIGSVDSVFNTIEREEIVNLSGTTVDMYLEDESLGDVKIDVTRDESIISNGIRIIPLQTVTEAGTYRIEVIPRMMSGKYGIGKLYRFSYCPDGSHVFFDSEQSSKTNDQSFTATGSIRPAPESAELVFIQPNGVKKVKELAIGDDGEFALSYDDLIQEEGINSYYIRTTRKLDDDRSVLCDDIRRSLMYDIGFAGAEDPYIKP